MRNALGYLVTVVAADVVLAMLITVVLGAVVTISVVDLLRARRVTQ